MGDGGMVDEGRGWQGHASGVTHMYIEMSLPWRHHHHRHCHHRRHLFLVHRLVSSNLGSLGDGRDICIYICKYVYTCLVGIRVAEWAAVTPTYVTDCCDCGCRCHFDFVLCANLAMPSLVLSRPSCHHLHRHRHLRKKLIHVLASILS